MQIRKWLALLVSAALALSLLAGCGGKNQSLAQVILDLLDGQYANVAVEIDPDLEADLRQAVHEGETEEEIRAALEKILGSGVSFRLIGDGQQGDSAWNLILYPGSDPDAAARSAFTEWSKVFGSLPRDGQYTAQIAMIETENGYAILVKATVDKAASRDDDDDDDEPEEPEDPGYIVDNNGNYTVNDSDGLQNLLTGQANEAQEITAARAGGFEDVTIKLAAGSYSVKDTFTTPFKGTLQGESETNKATINITGGNGLFAQIADDGTVENLNITVANTISNGSDSGKAGAVAGQNNGTIQNCDVTINAGGSITADGDESDDVYAGGIAGENGGKISDCKVTISGGSITAANDVNGDTTTAGAVAGQNKGTIQNCDVTINGGSITAANDVNDVNDMNSDVYAGGIAGENRGKISNCHVNGGDISAVNGDMATCAGGIAGCNKKGTVEDGSVTKCKIEAGKFGDKIAAGGIVGLNENSSEPSTSVTGCYYITATADKRGDATVTNGSAPTAHNQNAGCYAGTKIGFYDETGEPVG